MPNPSQKLRIIVGGMVGQFPLGGVAWDYFHYVLGLAELGHDVYYHEDTWVWPFDPEKRYPTLAPPGPFLQRQREVQAQLDVDRSPDATYLTTEE